MQQFQKIHEKRQFSGNLRASTRGDSAQHPFRPHEADHEEDRKHEDDSALLVPSTPEGKHQQGQQDRQQHASDEEDQLSTLRRQPALIDKVAVFVGNERPSEARIQPVEWQLYVGLVLPPELRVDIGARGRRHSSLVNRFVDHLAAACTAQLRRNQRTGRHKQPECQKPQADGCQHTGCQHHAILARRYSRRPPDA
ncbi:hypothetical protein D3C86_1253240 [compost metagenome]